MTCATSNCKKSLKERSEKENVSFFKDNTLEWNWTLIDLEKMPPIEFIEKRSNQLLSNYINSMVYKGNKEAMVYFIIILFYNYPINK